MEEKEWLECNPVYVIKNDKLYYKRDILELPRNCKCKLTVECVHSESAYPTVPTLSIPNGYNGYITVNAEKYPQIPNLSTKKSSKLSIRIAEKYPGHLFCESNTGLLAVSFQSWIPAELKMSRWCCNGCNRWCLRWIYVGRNNCWSIFHYSCCKRYKGKRDRQA